MFYFNFKTSKPAKYLAYTCFVLSITLIALGLFKHSLDIVAVAFGWLMAWMAFLEVYRLLKEKEDQG